MDTEKPRVIKESPATLATYDLAVNEAADAFCTVGSGKALKWEIPVAQEAKSCAGHFCTTDFQSVGSKSIDGLEVRRTASLPQ
jgi:hypothetical protein